jgi:TMEM175 potassium channel family protein
VTGQEARNDLTRSDTTRVEAFSDAVLAIAITLLTLDLRIPDVEPGHLLDGLLAQWPGYMAYVASYLYIAVVWLNHKAAFKRIRQADRGLHWANLCILFTAALLPFPTAVVSHTLQKANQSDQRTAIALYAFINALACVGWLLFFQHLTRHGELVAEGVDVRFFPAERLRALIGIALYVVAGVLGYLVVPLISLAIFVAVPVFYGVTSSGLYQLRSVVHR